MVMYRKDLFEKAGLKMPETRRPGTSSAKPRRRSPTSKEIYGICLRGKAGWGENMAFLTARQLLRRALVR
jgi:sorbitol/mannitol transport system substrate-binding protein